MTEKTAAQKRQEQAADDNKKEADRRAARSPDKGASLKVTLRDTADSTVDAVTRSVAALGGQIKSSGKGTLTVESPPESERNPDSQRQKLVEGLLANPLVEEVESS